MNLLITGAWQQAENYMEEIRQCGHGIVFLPCEREEMPCAYEWIEGIVGNGIFLSHPIEKFINLKYIQLVSAGFDRVPMDYIRRHGIKIHNARGVYSAPMAEYAVAGVLSLYKNQRFFYENQKEHTWKKKRDLKELDGQRVCILGCGSVGIECAKRFQAFGCRVFGIDTRVVEHESFLSMYDLESIKEVLAQSDIVVITLPLTKKTKHIFDKKMFDSMKTGAVLVNIARGALIDTEALIEALKGHLGGAVLDVFEEEPLGENPLWDMDHVVITPHNSFVGSGNNARMSSVIMKNLEKC
ncbi:MAG: hydroxyacid dehydrogenase [Lachnospiraceae bacterium]|nr:hydroxyacid dehydrogenase [Lachnospiraceae bacterium]